MLHVCDGKLEFGISPTGTWKLELNCIKRIPLFLLTEIPHTRKNMLDNLQIMIRFYCIYSDYPYK